MAETPPIAPPYEPSRIEQVFTLDDLEREVLYAGADAPISVDVT
jgi:hypothetical protein